MNTAVDIRNITEPLSPAHVAEINDLLSQLSSRARPASIEHLQQMVLSDNVYFIAAMLEQHIIGYVSLILAPIPSGFHGYIEDVVVDATMRGRGTAEALVRTALDIAAANGARRVDLTSNPAREAANRLYQRIGFQQRITNVYRYTFATTEPAQT